MSEFRSKVEPEVEVIPQAKGDTTISTTNVEVPYLSYHAENGKPYVADLFELGSNWESNYGGFQDEVETIESYLEKQVLDREIENSLKGVKNRLKEIEKITGIDKEDRTVVKLGVIKAYVKFLMEKNDIKKNIAKYG